MTSYVQIPIPDFRGLDDDSKALLQYVESKKDSLAPALDLTVPTHDRRILLDGWAIVGAEVSDEGIEVQYEVNFSAYMGCRDHSWEDTEVRSAVGNRVDSQWVFEVYEPPEARSTIDEF